jgi:hypothetical protein
MGRLASLGAVAYAVLAVAGARAADNQLTAREKAAGWQLLFDGRSFAGWEDPTRKSPPGDSFVIGNGCLKAVANPRFTEDLFTVAAYRDFELEFDWKIAPGGNSGVKYRIEDRVPISETQLPKFEDQVNASLKKPSGQRIAGQEYVVGFEYQLLDNALNPDARNGATHQAGALYDVLPPLRDATKPVGQWNHSRLALKGDRVEHWLNGVKVAVGSLAAPEVERAAAKRWGAGSPVYELLVKQPRKECPISLQNHDSEAWFRNLKIRRL